RKPLHTDLKQVVLERPMMMSSVIPARLQFQCGHAALVTLPRVKGETTAQRNERIAREKSSALARQCDFCAPTVDVAAATNGTHAVTADLADVIAAEPIAVAEPDLIAESIVIAEPAEIFVETVAVAEEPAAAKDAG